MLNVTTSAWERLAQILADRPTITAIRLRFADGEFRCCSGKRRDVDEVIEHTNRPTLIMSPAVANHLSHRTLDAPQTKRGPRLRLKPEQTLETTAEGN